MLTLKRWYHDDCTIGRLKVGAFQCFTLELPDKNNQPFVSCIPEGEYMIDFYDSPKHGRVLLLHSVPHRQMIEIHAGNYTRQIEGCILVGDSVKWLDDDSIPDVTNSKATLEKLLKAVEFPTMIKVTS